MLIVAYSAEVPGEGLSEVFSICDCVVVSLLFMLLDRLDHFGGAIRIHIVVSQPGGNVVDYLSPGACVQLDFIRLRTRRQCADADPLDPGRRRAGQLQHAKGINVVCPAMNKECEPVGRAVQDRNECEAAGLVAKGGQTVRVVLRIIFLNISRNPIVLPTIECFEKCSQGLAGRGVGWSYIGAGTKGCRKQSQDKEKRLSKDACYSF